MKKGMKLIVVMVLAVLVLGMLAGCGTKEKEIVGGWSKAEDGTITEELQEMFDKAMEGTLGVDYKPVELLETQLVSGTNYKFLCEATVVAPNAETKEVIVTIYKDLKGNLEVLEIEDKE